MRDHFFFTYGTEGHPFRGGWTVVAARDREEACRLFRAVHPDKIEGLLNCCAVYTSAEFLHTSMYRDGNFGATTQESILHAIHYAPEEVYDEL